jgi:uncharacterized protein YndB with AHSA1/START domain
MARAETYIEIRRPPAAVFETLADFERAPEWLQSCKFLKQVSAGAHKAGAKLRYGYELPQGAGEMGGRIAAYEPGARLAMAFTDEKFDVAIEFHLEPTDAGTRVVHAIDITMRFDMPRFMEAIVLAENRKQVGNNLSRLKRRIEAAVPPNAIDDSPGAVAP